MKVTVWPFQTLKQELVHLKDPVPEKQKKGVMYSIPCGECPWMYVHRSDRQDTGSSPGRAPMGSQERGCVSFSNC